jgi:hypothetical protein
MVVAQACLFSAASECKAARLYALLIGCSKYEDDRISALPGASNDVALFARFLRDELAFEDIETLSGWPDDVAKRPTFVNISKAFGQLISRVEANSQVIILLSGHGYRFPLPESQTDVLDPSNPEPDGLDEAFLAADYHSGTNMILDNQVGAWLDQLRARGAHVWITFDSCFSGTMMRGGADETPREIDSEAAGIPRAAITAARQRAAAAQQRRISSHDGLDLAREAESNGSVVAFYAAQDFETAPEVTRPQGADIEDPQHKHGLLSYHVLQTLRHPAARITYRDLGWMLVSRYREEGRTRPTPFFEGDLDREVLGLREWPRPKPLVLEKLTDTVRLAAGELSNVNNGTILSVHHESDKDYETVLGHIQVTMATATAAVVEAVVFGDESVASPLTELPDRARCKIVSQSLTSPKIKLALLPASDPRDQRATGQLAAELASLSDVTDGIFEIVNDNTAADWQLAVVSPESAQEQFGLDVEDSVWVLVEAATRMKTDAASALVHARYVTDNVSRVAAQVQDDLHKIYVWKNMWQIAGAYAAPQAESDPQYVKLDVATLAGPEDISRGQSLRTSRLSPGETVVLRVVNTGYRPHWFVVFYLNGRYGIQHVKSGAIRGKDLNRPAEQEVLRFQVDQDSVGSNGFVVIAVSQREHPSQPDYRFLAQTRLGVAAPRASADASRLESPFEKLLLRSLDGRGRFRSVPSPDEPQIASWSWVTAPVATPK